jgi:ribonuclease P/MRP protein subunit POP5|uniref:Ribonuclease P/MRP protein subunit POP5 n=1 Tax=Picea sitchensis TaxID=3332 RepID=A9NTF1_PICSI|nr:unknown [Picea sitchensis]
MVAHKNRYLVFEIFLDPNRESGKEDDVVLNQFSIMKAIHDSLLINFGEHGLASCVGYLQVKYANPITKLCIVRCLRKDYHKVWCAITLITSIEQCPAFFNLLDLSGSIRACKNYALKYDKAKFEQYKLMRGDQLSEVILTLVHNCFGQLKILER